jgi:hypothetical protein
MVLERTANLLRFPCGPTTPRGTRMADLGTSAGMELDRRRPPHETPTLVPPAGGVKVRRPLPVERGGSDLPC